MKNHKLFKVFNSINHSGQKDFEAWLFGKFKGKKTLTWNLFQLISKKGAANWEDKKVWKTLFKGESFNQKRYNREVSNLYRPLMGFIPFIQLKDDEAAQTLYRLKGLNRPGLDQEFNNLWKNDIVPVKESKKKSTDDWYFLYQAELELHKNRIRNSLSSTKSNLPCINKSFNQYWMLESLLYACYNISHNRIHGPEIDTESFKLLLPIIDKNEELTSQPLFIVYRNIYDLLSNGYTDRELITILNEHKNELHESDLKTAFVLLLNHYTGKINAGNLPDIFFRKLIKIYLWGYKQKFLHDNGVLFPGHYRNIVSICFRLKDYELAKSFIEEWKQDLPEDFRDISYELNLAAYFFYKGDYSKVREILRDQPKANSFHTIYLRIFELRIVYEEKYAPYTPISLVNDPLDLINQIKALQKFIRSQNKLSEGHQRGYLKRLNIFVKLLNAKTLNGLLKIKREIENDPSIDHSLWLYEKVLQRLKQEFGISDEW